MCFFSLKLLMKPQNMFPVFLFLFFLLLLSSLRLILPLQILPGTSCWSSKRAEIVWNVCVHVHELWIQWGGLCTEVFVWPKVGADAHSFYFLSEKMSSTSVLVLELIVNSHKSNDQSTNKVPFNQKHPEYCHLGALLGSWRLEFLVKSWADKPANTTCFCLVFSL